MVAALIPVHTALDSSLRCNRLVAIQETTESKSVGVTFFIDSLQSVCWAILEPRQIVISIQYLHRHLDRQAGQREVLFFCQPRALPNETLPAHSTAEIAGRVTFSSLFLSPDNTLHC